ncbi:MAG: hypothetical protein ACI8P0_000271 [Planctomycetaceae bacterium]
MTSGANQTVGVPARATVGVWSRLDCLQISAPAHRDYHSARCSHPAIQYSRLRLRIRKRDDSTRIALDRPFLENCVNIMRLHRWLLIGILTFSFSSIAIAISFADEENAATTENAEEEEAKPLMDQEEALDWALPVALFLAATHFAAPALRRFIEANEAKVSSIGGGMAASYVFIHLMGELDEGLELVGDRIHLFVLFGFISYYGV